MIKVNIFCSQIKVLIGYPQRMQIIPELHLKDNRPSTLLKPLYFLRLRDSVFRSEVAGDSLLIRREVVGHPPGLVSGCFVLVNSPGLEGAEEEVLRGDLGLVEEHLFIKVNEILRDVLKLFSCCGTVFIGIWYYLVR